MPGIRETIFHWFHWWYCLLRFLWRSYFSLQFVFAFDVAWLCPPHFFPGMCSFGMASPPTRSHHLLTPSIHQVLSFLFLIPIDFFMEMKLCGGNYLKNWAQGYYNKKNLLIFSSITWQNKFPGAIVRSQSPGLFKTQLDKVMVDVLAEIPFAATRELKRKKYNKKIFFFSSIFL